MAEPSFEDLYKRLSEGLTTQRNETKKYREYYDGVQPLAFTTSTYRATFSEMLKAVVDNWCPIVVDAVEERLHVQGFRFSDDGKGDKEANLIWQYNHLDSDSELLHSDTLIAGVGYVMVWGEDGKPFPTVSVEPSEQFYAIHAAGSRRQVLAAIKMFEDEWTGKKRVNLFTPDTLFKFIDDDGKISDMDEIRNPLGVVPVVPFYNRPKLLPGSYRSELREVLSTQDQINKILADAILASEFAAFRQRWATGVEVPINEETGKPIEPFESSVNRMFITPDPEARFGTFEAADLTNYVRLMENRIQSLASRTRTPPHYLLGNSGSFPSGESLKSTETGLIAKVRSRMRHFGEAWEQSMRLAFNFMGDTQKANYFSAETIWDDPESRTESEHVDALVKLRSIGVPVRVLWSRAGFTETEIDRFVAYLAEERLTESLNSPVINVGAVDSGRASVSISNRTSVPEPTDSPISES